MDYPREVLFSGHLTDDGKVIKLCIETREPPLGMSFRTLDLSLEQARHVHAILGDLLSWSKDEGPQ